MKTKITGVVLFAIVIATALCLAGCGKSQTYGVGETVETDVVSFTLDRAELAIALENSGAGTFGYGADGLATDEYFMPKDYDPQNDATNPYVAAKGHTLVSITFSAKNLDRTGIELFDRPEDEISIKYNDKVFTGSNTLSHDGDEIEVEVAVENKNGSGWKGRERGGTFNKPVTNVLLSPDCEASYKAYVDIPVEIENLDSPFEITFYLPKSDGERQPFTFSVN